MKNLSKAKTIGIIPKNNNATAGELKQLIENAIDPNAIVSIDGDSILFTIPDTNSCCCSHDDNHECNCGGNCKCKNEEYDDYSVNGFFEHDDDIGYAIPVKQRVNGIGLSNEEIIESVYESVNEYNTDNYINDANNMDYDFSTYLNAQILDICDHLACIVDNFQNYKDAKNIRNMIEMCKIVENK